MNKSNNVRVLMVTSSLDIGGAETHIKELSKGLYKRGNTVFVASSGGVFASELQNYGILHYTLPFLKKDPFSIIRCFFGLINIIKRENIHIIHAHARIPALVANLVSTVTRIPIVTTVHFNFKVSPLLKRLTKWGERSLVVSEDLIGYLTKNYKINPRRISRTINGVDTDTFSPDIDRRGILAELGLDPSCRFVVSVSRMDKNACKSTYLLLDCAKALYEKFPDIRIVLTGKGDALDDIRERASKINSQTTENYITVTGGRTDINRICALSDLFVGVSRAALEAMSCEKPVILAGNQGYLGLFDESKLDDCIRTNFTCRGIDYPSDSALLDELVDALSGKFDLTSAAAYSRKIVLELYSVERMAINAERLYCDTLKRRISDKKRKFDFTILGYYGYLNSGDDALLTAIINNLRASDSTLKLCILTKNPRQAFLDYDVFSVHRFNPFKVLYALSKSRVFLFGGGNLLQDLTSSKSLYYYLSLLKCAKLFGAKTMLYANGLGPINKPVNFKMVSAVLKDVDKLTLREPHSYNLALSMGLPSEKVFKTADEVFSISACEEEVTIKNLEALGLSDTPFYCVSLRDFKNGDADFINILTDVIHRAYSEFGVIPLFVPMQEELDLALSLSVISHLKCPSRILTGSLSVSEVIGIMSKSSGVLGMRLHALIYGAAALAPLTGIVYDIKVPSFLDYLGETRKIDYTNIDKALLWEYLSQMLKDDRKPAERLVKLKETAAKNCREAIALLEETL